MKSRHPSLLDRCITEFDHALRVIAGEPTASAAAPGETHTENDLNAQEKAESARLMRVNHSGEVAAQALYRGQAVFARDDKQRAKLLAAAAEENDHLAWCQQRTSDLGGRTSLLAPAWYAGSFTIGVAAGLSGDQISMGFLAETERQVADHLDYHLSRLPKGDEQSRAILTQMHADEVRHGSAAKAQGAIDLPSPIKTLMRCASRVMTSVSYRV
jgi:ubiquinone biosynthesis monooxygenase Coq7